MIIFVFLLPNTSGRGKSFTTSKIIKDTRIRNKHFPYWNRVTQNIKRLGISFSWFSPSKRTLPRPTKDGKLLLLARQRRRIWMNPSTSFCYVYCRERPIDRAERGVWKHVSRRRTTQDKRDRDAFINTFISSTQKKRVVWQLPSAKGNLQRDLFAPFANVARLYIEREKEIVFLSSRPLPRSWGCRPRQGLGCQGRRRRPTPDPRGPSDRF
jgi:hypothetical protein